MKASSRAIALLVASFVLVLTTVSPAGAAPTIQGAGASFPQLEIEQWRADVSQKPYNLSVNYVSSGSTFGRNQYMNNLVDFGVSDIPFQADELDRAAKRPYAYVAVSAGGVGFMYNLKDTNGKRIFDLKLRPRTACRAFTEVLMYWDDPEIKADNPGVALPHKKVAPVYRSDGNGTGFVTQQFCIATAPDVWTKFVAAVKSTPVLFNSFENDPFIQGLPSSRWPPITGSQAFASDGVADAVADGVGGDGRITYVEAGFAEIRNMPNALVRNAAGVFNYPESCNVARALTHASNAGNGTVRLDFTTPDPDAYFPSSYSYAIVPTSGISADRASVLTQFLNYAVTKGQERADELGYAPLSKEIIDIALAEIRKIPGAPASPAYSAYTPGDCGGGTPEPGGGGGSGTDSGGGGNSGSGSGGDSSGGGAGGGAASGGSSSGGTPNTGGATGSGGSVDVGGATQSNGSASGGGQSTSATGAARTGDNGASTATNSSTGANTAAGGGGTASRTTQATARATNASTSGRATAAAAPTVERDLTTGPGNQQVLWAVLQGAALCAAGAALSKRFRGSAA